jgi:hypothetical protein
MFVRTPTYSTEWYGGISTGGGTGSIEGGDGCTAIIRPVFIG